MIFGYEIECEREKAAVYLQLRSISHRAHAFVDMALKQGLPALINNWISPLAAITLPIVLADWACL